jgi:tRNA-splicing ligase RtcB
MIKERLKKISENVWEVPQGVVNGMNVPGRIFTSEKLLPHLEEGAIKQVANVACLPGIYKYSIGLPDIHFGYGFPIGGVAALDFNEGGISPGGIGYDINCGVRLLRTNLNVGEAKPKLRNLLDALFTNIGVGVGEGGKLKLSQSELKNVLEEGAEWCVKKGYGRSEDLEVLEENGRMKDADASKVSQKALQRGASQPGSLGAGNHFLEVQVVDKIFDASTAKVFGVDREGQVTVMIHSGSRGLGHQVCTDYLQILENAFRNLVHELPDRELVYAPAGSKQAEGYWKAMCSAANYAWVNRSMIMHWTRESFSHVFGRSAEELGMEVIYDVAHNIAKVEEHEIDGVRKKVFVHRKGGTRSFPPGHPQIPQKYRSAGQPVLLPGDMGTASYLLVGTKEAMQLSFGSTAHGAGRAMSRTQALKRFRGEQVKKDLESKGILVRSASWDVLAEEVPDAYKDIDEIAKVSHAVGIGKLVARMKPIAVVKG